jgi:hypothetical protein
MEQNELTETETGRHIVAHLKPLEPQLLRIHSFGRLSTIRRFQREMEEVFGRHARDRSPGSSTLAADLVELTTRSVDRVNGEVAEKLGRKFGRYWFVMVATDEEAERLEQADEERRGRWAGRKRAGKPAVSLAQTFYAVIRPDQPIEECVGWWEDLAGTVVRGGGLPGIDDIFCKGFITGAMEIVRQRRQRNLDAMEAAATGILDFEEWIKFRRRGR